jgi:hypothetical protein
MVCKASHPKLLLNPVAPEGKWTCGSNEQNSVEKTKEKAQEKEGRVGRVYPGSALVILNHHPNSNRRDPFLPNL